MPAIAALPVPVTLFGSPLGPGTLSSMTASHAGGSMAAVNATAAVPSGTATMTGISSAASSQAPFADLLTEAVGQVESYERQAKSAIEGLMTGQGVDVHQAMIASEKAESGFELVLAVRNKALSAYQQVMGMQF